jgi:capping protein alpha
LYEIHSFRFDHLRREASDYEPYETDEQAESWRLALEKELSEYTKDRYTYGVCTVVGTSNDDTITLSAYIESHKFEAKNFW